MRIIAGFSIDDNFEDYSNDGNKRYKQEIQERQINSLKLMQSKLANKIIKISNN